MPQFRFNEGRLFALGWAKLWFGLNRIRQDCMWALGVVPEYQGKAIDTLLYQATFEARKDQQVLYGDQLHAGGQPPHDQCAVKDGGYTDQALPGL